MVKHIKQSLWKRFKAEVPKIIKKIQYVSAGVAGLDACLIIIKDKYPEVAIPDSILSVVMVATILNMLILQFTTHKDFEK